MRKKRQDPEEKLEKHAEELDELRDFVDTTTFSGDEREMTGEVSTVDQHPGDGADFTFQRELMETTRQIIDQEAQQVQDAIERRAEGTYGICESCGRPIPPERLAVRPSATRCVECQQELERNRAA